MENSISLEDQQGRLTVINHIENVDRSKLYSGELLVENGKITSDVLFIHARSEAENVTVQTAEGAYNGTIKVVEGKPQGDVAFSGKSLVHSAALTAIAFTKGFFGESGQYIVAIGLLLFAFSTAISWSYYGDRAMTFIFGSKSVVFYRIVYVIAFFFAAFTDTTIIWTLSAIAIAVMTLPNLLGILLLHKDMKQTVKEYWLNFKEEWPNEKTPE